MTLGESFGAQKLSHRYAGSLGNAPAGTSEKRAPSGSIYGNKKTGPVIN